jgi:hypothetical protein
MNTITDDLIKALAAANVPAPAPETLTEAASRGVKANGEQLIAQAAASQAAEFMKTQLLPTEWTPGLTVRPRTVVDKYVKPVMTVINQADTLVSKAQAEAAKDADEQSDTDSDASDTEVRDTGMRPTKKEARRKEIYPELLLMLPSAQGPGPPVLNTIEAQDCKTLTEKQRKNALRSFPLVEGVPFFPQDIALFNFVKEFCPKPTADKLTRAMADLKSLNSKEGKQQRQQANAIFAILQDTLQLVSACRQSEHELVPEEQLGKIETNVLTGALLARDQLMLMGTASVEKFMAALQLPKVSDAIRHLAARELLTTAEESEVLESIKQHTEINEFRNKSAPPNGRGRGIAGGRGSGGRGQGSGKGGGRGKGEKRKWEQDQGSRDGFSKKRERAGNGTSQHEQQSTKVCPVSGAKCKFGAKCKHVKREK